MPQATNPAFLDRLTQLVTKVIHESTGRKVTPKPDDRLIESGVLDSLSMVNLVIALQGEYPIELDTADLNDKTFGSVRAIADLLLARGVKA